MKTWFALLLLACVACPACRTPLVPIDVPQFPADDERVQTAGFVGQTLRLSREVDETEYTCMLFRVGDTLTLGAMVQGSFDGDVEWQVGRHTIRLPLLADSPSGEYLAALSPQAPAEELVGQRASFRGFTWINADVDVTDWDLEEHGRLLLTFLPTDTTSVVLPEDGSGYLLGFEPK